METNKIIPIHGDIQPSSFFNEVETLRNITKEVNHKEVLESLFIDYSKELPPPPISWTLEINGENYTCGTKGDFSVLIGKAKSKKTALLSMIANKWVKDNPTKKMLYFDTEQGEHDAINVIKRIVRNAPNPQNILPYHLRSKNPLERLELIEFAIENTSDVELVIVDGIRDLVSSINDEEQATKIASKLLKWTDEKKFHLITIIHQNKGDNNARGHLGTELINKAQLVLSVTKDSDDESKSIVKKEYDRNAPLLPDFSIKINESNQIEIEGIVSKKATNSNSNKLGLHDIKDETWGEILPRVFKDNLGLKYNDLITELRVDLESQFNVSIGRNRIVDHITNLRNKGFIEKIGKDGSRDARYILTSV
jgi:hypothetical protein